MTSPKPDRRRSIAPESNVTSVPYIFAQALHHFTTHLEARLLAGQTVESYRRAVNSYARFHAGLGLADNVAVPTHEHIELWVADLAQKSEPATVINRFKGLRAFFKWLLSEGEIREHPMTRMPWPKVPEKIIRALSAEAIQAMLDTCERNLTGRRDSAFIMFLVDSIWRVSEALAITVEMVLEGRKLVVTGKGGKQVMATLAPPTREAINRYLRLRQSYRPELWLTRTGKPMTRHDAFEVIQSRATRAGVGSVSPHQLRHSAAILWLKAGGNLMDLKENMGHSSIKTTERYLRYLAQETAMEARRYYSPGYLFRPH